MDWKNIKLLVLGLEKKEKDVLQLLKDPLSIQEISSRSPIPRTTIAYIINKLIKRGFVEKVKLGKRYKYYSIPQEKLRSFLEDAYSMGRNKDEYTSPHITPVSSKRVSCYQGLKNIIRLQAHFLSSYKNERVYAIQPNKSWLSLHSKVDEDRVIHVNNLIRNNNLIIDAVIENDAYENFKKANQSKRKFLKLAKSFGNRMADYASSPKGYMTDQVEMWIIKDTAIFIDWREEVAIKIIDTHVAHFLKDMFLLTKEQGRRIDHNKAIQDVLK
jgi:sugar-specific transcriptional regulator TrmB